MTQASDTVCSLDHTDALAGGDGVQLYDTKQYGSVIWGLKLQDRNPTTAAKDDTWAPLGIVEGPTEPRKLDSILARVIQFFTDHDPGTFS